MDDRGEKIINLAREMLRTDIVLETESAPAKAPISFKVLCLATMIAALGSSALTGWINESRRPLNRYEKTELNALVFYAARLNNVEQDSIRQEIEAKIGVDSFDDLTEQEFQKARRLLQDKAQ